MTLITGFLESQRGLFWVWGLANICLNTTATRSWELEGLCLCCVIPSVPILTKSQSTQCPHHACLVLNFKKACSDLEARSGVMCGELSVV